MGTRSPYTRSSTPVLLPEWAPGDRGLPSAQASQLNRQQHRHRGAAADAGTNGDAAAVGLHNAAHDGQAQARAASLGAAEKRTEGAPALRRGHAFAGIGKINGHMRGPAVTP